MNRYKLVFTNGDIDYIWADSKGEALTACRKVKRGDTFIREYPIDAQCIEACPRPFMYA